MMLFELRTWAAPNLGSIAGAFAAGTVINIRSVLTRTRRALKPSFRFQSAVETLSPEVLNSTCPMTGQRPRYAGAAACGRLVGQDGPGLLDQGT
jgi:hypothetical protein